MKDIVTKYEPTHFPVRDRLLFVAVLLGWLSLSSEWTLFILGSFLYTFTTVYLASKSWLLRVRLGRMRRCMFLAGIIAVTVCFTLVLLLAGVVPMPDRVVAYFIYTMVLAPLTIVLTERLLKKGGLKK